MIFRCCHPATRERGATVAAVTGLIADGLVDGRLEVDVDARSTLGARGATERHEGYADLLERRDASVVERDLEEHDAVHGSLEHQVVDLGGVLLGDRDRDRLVAEAPDGEAPVDEVGRPRAAAQLDRPCGEGRLRRVGVRVGLDLLHHGCVAFRGGGEGAADDAALQRRRLQLARRRDTAQALGLVGRDVVGRGPRRAGPQRRQLGRLRKQRGTRRADAAGHRGLVHAGEQGAGEHQGGRHCDRDDWPEPADVERRHGGCRTDEGDLGVRGHLGVGGHLGPGDGGPFGVQLDVVRLGVQFLGRGGVEARGAGR